MTQVVYQDQNIAVLNKPAGLAVLRDRSGAPCLWDSLPAMLGCKPYLVHRLDKPTSGVLVVALNPDTQRQLTRQFQARQVRKFYLAWVVGRPPSTGVIDLPLKKGRKNRFRVAGPRVSIVRTGHRWRLLQPMEDGHPSLTRFRVKSRRGRRSLLVLSPKSGRTHQLRVHLAWIGYPILGDPLYGRPDDPQQRAHRLLLHAHRLVLPEHGAFTIPPDRSLSP